jgi:hypothetical protein
MKDSRASPSPLNSHSAPPAEKDRSGGQAADHLSGLRMTFSDRPGPPMLMLEVAPVGELSAALSKPGDHPTTAREAEVMAMAVARAGRTWLGDG